MPTTIIIAGSLVNPPPWCGRRLSAVVQRVKHVLHTGTSRICTYVQQLCNGAAACLLSILHLLSVGAGKGSDLE